MDYDKHRYEQSKRERELRKNQRIVTLKEVQLSATIEENDVQTKFKNAVKFLQDGDKVKVSIRFRGRQIAHADIGLKIMQDFAARIEEYGTIERRPMLEGRHMIMILAPKAEKKSFAEKSQQRKEKHAAAQAAKASEPEKRELKPPAQEKGQARKRKHDLTGQTAIRARGCTFPRGRIRIAHRKEDNPYAQAEIPSWRSQAFFLHEERQSDA